MALRTLLYQRSVFTIPLSKKQKIAIYPKYSIPISHAILPDIKPAIPKAKLGPKYFFI